MGKRAAKSDSSSDSSSEEEEQAKVVTKQESGSDSDSSDDEEVAKPSPKKKAKTTPMVAGGATGRKIFVGGIAFSTEEDGLREFFKDCGEIEDIHLPIIQETGYKRGFGFVTFTEASGAEEACKLNDGELDGRWLNIRVAEDKVARDDGNQGAGEPQLKVFVGGLNWETTEDSVKEFFKDCGETTDVYFPTDRETGNYRGFCFITFEELDGSAASCAKNGEELDGKWLKVNYSQPKPEGGKGGKGSKGGKGKGGKGKGSKGGGKGKGKGKGW